MHGCLGIRPISVYLDGTGICLAATSGAGLGLVSPSGNLEKCSPGSLAKGGWGLEQFAHESESRRRDEG